MFDIELTAKTGAAKNKKRLTTITSRSQNNCVERSRIDYPSTCHYPTPALKFVKLFF